LWAAVPAYASQIPSPKAALALVERACSMLGCPAPVAGLANLAHEYDVRVSTLVDADDDLSGYVERLESMTDQGYDIDESDDIDDDDDDEIDPASDIAQAPEVDGDELMAELERFLRDQNDGT
jgi:hypothetical protein